MRNSKAELSRRSVLAGLGVAIAGSVVATPSAFAATTTSAGVASTAAVDSTALADIHNPFDATSGALTVTLPTGQNPGTRVSVEKVDSSANTVTLSGNVRGIPGSTIPLVWQHESIELVADSLGSWWPIAGHNTKSSLDAAYAIVVNGNLYSSLSDALTAGAGKTVYVPADYAATITNAITIPASTRLIFGTGSTLSVPNATASGVFIMSDNSTLIGNGLVIDGGGPKSTDAKAIYALSVANVTVEDVTIQNWHGDAIHLRATDRAHVRDCYVDGVTRTDPFFGQGIRLTNGNDATNTTNTVISGCHVRSCAGSGIQGDGQWNSSSWRTAGAKIVDTTITGCTSHNNAYAGIWINTALRCTISDSHANNNGDYGFGYEFSQDSVMTGCTASGNLTNGFAFYQTNDRCSIVGCTAANNLVDGVMMTYVGGISGDVPSSDLLVANCIVRSNGCYGIAVRGINRAKIVGCNSRNDSTGVYIDGSTGVSVSDTSIYGSSCYGVYVNSSNAGIHVEGCEIASTIDNGIQFGSVNSGTLISSSLFRGIVNSAIFISNYKNEVTISGCTFKSNLHAIFGNSTANYPVAVMGNSFSGHGGSAIQARGVYEWRIIGNTFDEPTAPGVDLLDNSGTSGARLIVQNNFIRSGGAAAIRISAGGKGTVSSDYYVIADNSLSLIGTAVPIVYSAMGTTAGIEYRGSGRGSPEGVIYAKPGSMYRRTDGGARTSLYIKESGVGNTGWLGK